MFRSSRYNQIITNVFAPICSPNIWDFQIWHSHQNLALLYFCVNYSLFIYFFRWVLASFHLPIRNASIRFRKVPVQIACPFLIGQDVWTITSPKKLCKEIISRWKGHLSSLTLRKQRKTCLVSLCPTASVLVLWLPAFLLESCSELEPEPGKTWSWAGLSRSPRDWEPWGAPLLCQEGGSFLLTWFSWCWHWFKWSWEKAIFRRQVLPSFTSLQGFLVKSLLV